MARRTGIDFESLCAELDALIAAADRTAVSRARRERLLTDGYARALALEGERLKLERRIGQLGHEVSDRNKVDKADELVRLSDRLTKTSDKLAALRQRLALARKRTSAAA